MKISVIIPAYKRPQELELTLLSLSLQDFPKDEFEVLLVNDGPTKEVETVYKKLKSKLDINLTHLVHKKPPGFVSRGAVRNVGIKASKGEILLFLDSDIIVEKSFLREHYSFHKKDPDAVVLGYRFRLPMEVMHIADSLVRTGRTNEIHNLPALKDERILAVGKDIKQLSFRWKYLHTHNISLNRKHIEKIGLFDEAMTEWGFEDEEFGYRLAKAGLNFYLEKKPRAFHQEHYLEYEKQLYSSRRNARYFNKKHNEFEAEFTNELHRYMGGIENIAREERKISAIHLAPESTPKLPITPGKEEKLLVLGCGENAWLNEKSKNYCGFDHVKAHIEQAKQKFPGSQFYNFLGVDIPFEKDHFDRVYIPVTIKKFSEFYRIRIVLEALRTGKTVAMEAPSLDKTVEELLRTVKTFGVRHSKTENESILIDCAGFPPKPTESFVNITNSMSVFNRGRQLENLALKLSRKQALVAFDNDINAAKVKGAVQFVLRFIWENAEFKPFEYYMLGSSTLGYPLPMNSKSIFFIPRGFSLKKQKKEFISNIRNRFHFILAGEKALALTLIKSGYDKNLIFLLPEEISSNDILNAIKKYESLLENKKYKSRHYTVMGWSAFYKMNYAEAKKFAERALAEDPSSFQATLLKSLSSVGKGEFGAAAELLKKAFKKAKTNESRIQILNYLGIAEYFLGRKSEALKAWIKLLSLDQDNPIAKLSVNFVQV